MKEKIVTKDFCFAFMAIFSTSIVMYMLMSTITQYVKEFGATEFIAGTVSGIYVIGGVCSRLATGKSLEKFGLKKVALISAAVHFAACCFYPFVRNLVLLIIVRFVHGLGFGAATSAIITIAMTVIPKSRFGEGTGYFMMASTLSVGLGPFAGGYVYDAFGGMGCFVFAIIMSFLCCFFLLFVHPQEEEKPANAAESAVDEKVSWVYHILEPRAVPISIVAAFSALGYVGVMSFYRLYALETGLEKAFSYFFLIYGAFLIVTRPVAGKIQDKFGDHWVCIPGLCAQAIGLFLLSFRPGVLTLVICAAGCAMGYGALTSACNVMACQSAPAYRRGYAVTTFYLCCDAAMGFGPAMLGAVATASDYHIMYYVSCALTLAGLPLFLLINSRKKRNQS